jgi:hypothetical protein
MKKYESMKRYILCVISFCLISLSSHVNAQKDREFSTLTHYCDIVNKFNRVFPQEKVYLHFDNTGYYMNETIWFKLISSAPTATDTHI